MTRLAGWPEVLAAELAAARRKPFNWDGWSCYDFCAHVVLALTGVDHREHFPAYHSEAEAQALLAQYGGAVALTTHVLGQPMPSAACAQRGDVVVLDFGMGLQPAICAGLMSYAPGIRGLIARPTSEAIAAWTT